MKLLDIIIILEDEVKLEKFVREDLNGVEFDFIDTCMKKRIDVDSDIILFNANEMPNHIVEKLNENVYKSFLTLYTIKELLDHYKAERHDVPSEEIARLIIAYKKQESQGWA